MGFEIFATGTNFHFPNRVCVDGSTFEVINVITILQGLDVSSVGKFGISAVGAVKEKVAKGIPDLMFKMAEMEMCHNISNAVSMLAMNPMLWQIFIGQKRKLGGWKISIPRKIRLI